MPRRTLSEIARSTSRNKGSIAYLKRSGQIQADSNGLIEENEVRAIWGMPPLPDDAAPSKPVNTPTDPNNVFVKARAAREALNTKMLELDYLERTKTLVSAPEARAVIENMMATFRTAVAAIDARLAAPIAAETDVHRCKMMLRTEADRIIAEVQRVLTSWRHA